MPNIKHPKESPRNHKPGITAISPFIPQTTPINIEAIPVNGINTGYFIGCSAKMIKYTPIATYVADATRSMYSTSGECGG